MTKTDTPINVEAVRDPAHGDYAVSMCMCHTPRRIYVDNLTELGTNKSVHIYVERRTCHIEENEHDRETPTDFGGGWYTEITYDCDECGFENKDYNVRFCGGCGAEVIS